MTDAEIEDRVAAALYDEWAGDARRYERLGKHGKATWRGIARAGMAAYEAAIGEHRAKAWANGALGFGMFPGWKDRA